MCRHPQNPYSRWLFRLMDAVAGTSPIDPMTFRKHVEREAFKAPSTQLVESFAENLQKDQDGVRKSVISSTVRRHCAQISATCKEFGAPSPLRDGLLYAELKEGDCAAL